MDSVILKILLSIVKLFYRNDVDFEKLKIIAETKVMMDRRRSLPSYKNSQAGNKKNPLLLTMLMYAFTGLIIGMVIFANADIVLPMIITHAYLIFMMAMTLITDFSTVLLDTTDNQIIAPKPVSSKTFFLARVVHIFTYLLQFTIALIFFPLLFSFIKYGIVTGLVIFVTMILSIAFSVFLTYLLYGLMLRFSTEEKIKQVIGGFQIFMTIFFMAAYQLIPRMLDFGENFSYKIAASSYFLPPVWMALAAEAFYKWNFDTLHLIMIACTIIVPILTVWVMIKYIAPGFSKKVSQLGSGTAGSAANNATGNSTPISEKLSNIFCSTQSEKAGFEKTWKITSRDKQFKIMFYPSLAYLVVLAFIIFFNKKQDFSALWQNLPNTKTYIGLLYLPLFAILSGMISITINENAGAAWVYHIAPIKKPGEIIIGAVKSFMVKFLLPVYIWLFIFCLYIWGLKVVDDVVLSICSTIFLTFFIANISDHYLPFSLMPNPKQQSGKFAKTMLQLVIMGVLIVAHFFASKTLWLIYVLIPLPIVGAWFMLKELRNLSWKQISV